MQLKKAVSFPLRIIIAPIVSAPSANRKIRRSIKILEQDSISDDDPRLKLPKETLEGCYGADQLRLERIEDKARGSVFGVAIAISILAAGIGMMGKPEVLADERLMIRIFGAFCLLAAMIYFFLSANFALLSYRIGKRYILGLEDHPELTSDLRWKKQVLWCIDLNRKLMSIRGNHLSASFDCLRNGIVAIGLFLLISLLTAF